MARSRNLKPGFFQNEYLVELPYETRLLFAGLPCIADREGRLEDRPKKIKMQLFPADSVDIEAMLDALESAGFILRYQAQGNDYIQIVNFAKHQNPHHAEKESLIPAPGESEASPGQALDKPSSSRADSLNTDSFQNMGADPDGPGDESPDAKLYRTGKALLGKSAGGLITKLKNANGIEGAQQIIDLAATKQDPTEYVAACLTKIQLPKKASELWQIRKAAGLQQTYECSTEECHAEILAAVRANPDLAPAVRALT